MLAIANLEADTATLYRAVAQQAAALSHASMRDVLLKPYPPAVQAATIWLSSYYSVTMVVGKDVYAHDNSVIWDHLFECQTPPRHTALVPAPLELYANADAADADDKEAAGHSWRKGIERRQQGRMEHNSSFIVSDKVCPTPTTN